MAELYIFNPENDLALANGGSTYCAPPSARKIASDLASLPLWYASAGDKVLVPDKNIDGYYNGIGVTSSLKIASELVVGLSAADITACSPWGWSTQIIKRFRDMGVSPDILPSESVIGKYREISNRKTVIEILSLLNEAGIHTPDPLPQYLTSPEEVEHFILSMPRTVIKAPWSGSGKGLVWGRGCHETSVERLYRGIIKRQGGAVCERYLDKVLDFAMEFYSDGTELRFAGYSLFDTVKGVYCGNVLAGDAYIEDILCRYISSSELYIIRNSLLLILKDIIGECYIGYLGVDMMIYRDSDSCFINPCVELNLRMNMGVVARLFYDKYVEPGKRGEFKISYMREEGAALADHQHKCRNLPLKVKDGKIVSGYISLAPVSKDTNYRAEVIIE